VKQCSKYVECVFQMG